MNEKVTNTLAELKKFAEKIGYWPTPKQWHQHIQGQDLYTFSGLYYHLPKSWETLRKELGFPPRRKRYSKEECIEALQQASQYLGKFFTRQEYEGWRQGKDFPSHQVISNRCKGFNKAKELAGLFPNEGWGGRQFSDREIIEALRLCEKDLGPLFSESQYEEWRKEKDMPHVETIRKRLGGIPEAKIKMSMNTYAKGPNPVYNEGRWRAPFLDFLTSALNHEQYEKWAQENNGPSLSALFKHAGGYEKALLEMLPNYIDKIKENRKRR